MYRRGVRCVDCHDPHSLQLLATGNALCVRCHNQAPDPRFPTMILENYETPEHHFHPAGKPGTECVDCHMPATTYMVVDPRSDHSLRIPRPDLTVEIGTPNVCNGCHTDWRHRLGSSTETEVRQRRPTRQQRAAKPTGVVASSSTSIRIVSAQCPQEVPPRENAPWRLHRGRCISIAG